VSDALIETITPAALAEHLQHAGYRAAVTEQNGLVLLTSGCQGVGFMVRFGNPGESGSFLDFIFSAALRVMGDVPATLVPTWNQTRRFGRLTQQGQFLVLDMDLMLSGGITARNLRAKIELWDRLVQELLLYVRDRIAAAPAAAAPVAGEPKSAPAPVASAA
jgi:hypothetical protein